MAAMTRRIAAGALAALAGGALWGATAAAMAQEGRPGTTPSPPKPLVRTTFAAGEDGWKPIGEGVKVAAADADGGGRRALRLEYEVGKGKFGAAYLPVAENEIGPAKSVRFSVRPDRTTTLACVLQEKGGGRYVAMFHAPGAEWQKVALAPSDFHLATGENDPEDPNDELDLGQVEAVAVADLAQVWAQAGEQAAALLGAGAAGARSLLLSDFVVGRDPLPAPALPFVREDDDRLDSFRHPQVGWVAVGGEGVSLAFTSEKPLPSRGLKVSYNRSKSKVAGVLRPVPHGWMGDRDRLSLRLASDKGATVIVQLEEKGGGKYNAVVTVPAYGGTEGATAAEQTILFKDLKPTADSKDSNNKLNPYQVTQVLILDVTDLLPDEGAGSANDAAAKSGANTLYLSDLKAPKG